jgi:hypothetical protein
MYARRDAEDLAQRLGLLSIDDPPGPDEEAPAAADKEQHDLIHPRAAAADGAAAPPEEGAGGGAGAVEFAQAAGAAGARLSKVAARRVSQVTSFAGTSVCGGGSIIAAGGAALFNNNGSWFPALMPAGHLLLLVIVLAVTLLLSKLLDLLFAYFVGVLPTSQGWGSMGFNLLTGHTEWAFIDKFRTLFQTGEQLETGEHLGDHCLPACDEAWVRNATRAVDRLGLPGGETVDGLLSREELGELQVRATRNNCSLLW